MEQQSPPPEKPPENPGGMTRILLAVAIGLVVMIAVVVMANANQDSATVDPGRLDWGRLALALATLALVAGGSWRLLARLTPGAFLRNIAIWLVIGLGAAGLYMLIYPNGATG